MEFDNSDFEIKLTEININVGGSIPITWCISPKTIEFLNGKEAWVMLATTPMTPEGRRSEWRGFVKLTDMMAYVTFRKPGRCKLIAKVTTDKSSVKDWIDGFGYTFHKGVFKYPYLILDEDGIKKWSYSFNDYWWDKTPQGELELDIPAECFAPDPPEWEKKWVNLLLDDPTIDQCHYRKKRLFAWTAQPIVLLAIWLGTLGFAILPHLFGFYNPNWKTVHPFNGWRDTDPLWDSETIKSPFLFSIFGIKNAGLSIPIIAWSGLIFGPKSLLILVCTFAFIIFCVLIHLVFEKYIPKLFRIFGRRKYEKESKKEEALIEIRNVEYQTLLCDRAPTIKSIKDLPKEKRTVKLIFNDLKSKVCKPYSG